MMTSKGQVTIPKRIRDELGLVPGQAVEFAAGATGEVVLRKPGRQAAASRRDRFARARGGATVQWHDTDELMTLLRGDD